MGYRISHRAERVLSSVIANGGVALLLLAWHWAARGSLQGILPSPVDVFWSLVDNLQTGKFLSDTGMSLLRVLISVGAAMVIGGLLALLPFWFPILSSTVHRSIKPVVSSFPSIAWALLAAIWFGASDFSVVFVQTAILLPFCLINVGEGVRLLNRDMIEMARSFTGRGDRVLFMVILPLLSPYLLAALRAAYGIGWKIALVAELFGSTSGLGYALLRAEMFADTNTVFAVCAIVVLFGIVGDRLVIGPLEARFRGTTSL